MTNRPANYGPPPSLFELPTELEDLKRLTRDIVESECIPLEQRFLSEDPLNSDQGTVLTIGDHRYRQGALPAHEWLRLRQISIDAGLYNVDLPEDYGGLGLGVLGSFVVSEEANRSLVQLPTAKIPEALYGGTEYQKDRYLRPLLESQKRYAFALTEPQAGSDAAALRTSAQKAEGGGWVINGTKAFISGADEADFLLVFALTDAELRQRGGITLFIVDADAPGVSISPVRLWHTTTAHQFTVHLDDVAVDEKQVLGEVGQGFRLGQRWLAIHDRLSRGALACGILSRALEMALSWAEERSTFGAPLADRQAIQWMMVDVFNDLKTIRAASYECAARADAGQDVQLHSARAKLLAGELGHRAIDRVMQIFGGTGEVEEFPVASWYRTLRHARIGGGTDEMQRIQIARGLRKQGAALWLA